MADQNSIDIRCYFNHSGYPGDVIEWRSPLEEINDILDTTKHPLWYQQLVPITKLIVSHNLGSGRSAKITFDTLSSRDVFDFIQEEGMVNRSEPFREWEITLTDRNTPSPSVVFRGFPVSVEETTLDDREIEGEQDGNWEYTIRLEGPEYILQSNSGLHMPRALKAFSYNPIISLLLAELNTDYTPLAHTQFSFDELQSEYQKEPFIDLGNTDVQPEISVSLDSTTWDILKKIAEELSDYSLISTGESNKIPKGNTYAVEIDPEFKIDFIPSNFRDGQDIDEWFRNTEDTFIGGTQSTRILGENPHYGTIGQTFTAQNDFIGVYAFADMSEIVQEGKITISLKTAREGTVIATETKYLDTTESTYSLRFPTQKPGTYYFEMVSVIGDNNIALKVREDSTYEGGKLWLRSSDWYYYDTIDLELKLLSPPYIKLSPVITKEHIAVQTGAVVRGDCGECPDAVQFEQVELFDLSDWNGDIEVTGSTFIGQKIDMGIVDPSLTSPDVQKLLNTIEIPIRNVESTRALARLTVYNDITKDIMHSQTLIPFQAHADDKWYSAYVPVGVYSNNTTTYYWELETVSGTIRVPYKNGLYAGAATVDTYVNGAHIVDKHFGTYYVRGKCCTGWARYPDILRRNAADEDDYERPSPAEYGLRGERKIEVDFNSNWVLTRAAALTRCRNLAKEHVAKHNYPSYTAEFTIMGGYVRDLVGKYVLLYNPYEKQEQTFLVTEQEHEFEKGWNSLKTTFVTVRSGNKL